MKHFCKHCGTELAPTSRFCPACGATSAAPAAHSAPAPGAQADTPAASFNPAALGIALGLAALSAASAGAWYGGFFDASLPSDAATETPGAAALDPNTRPPEWFANYKDRFLSGEVIRYAAAKAELRNFPTAQGTMSLRTLEAGQMVVGRLVQGGDADSQWLRTSEGTYVWSGNLAERPVLAPTANGAAAVSVANVRLGRSVLDGQIADFAAGGTFSEKPANVVVQFDYTGTVPGQDYTCALRDPAGAIISATSGYFQSEASFVWCSFPSLAPGTYDLILTSQGASTWLSAFQVIDPGQDAAIDAAAAH